MTEPEPTPPHNLEVEAALLGACLRNEGAFYKVFDRLEAEHFYAPEHGLIWAAMMAMNAKGKEINATKLAHYADSEAMLTEIGGAQYLFTLVANVIAVVNAGDYADTIIDLWKCRACIDAAEEAVNGWYDPNLGMDPSKPDFTTDGVAEQLEGKLADIADTGGGADTVIDIATASDGALSSIEAAHKSDGHVVGLATGLRDLDAMIGGLIGGKLYIIAARPGMGKTTLGFGWGFDIARNDPPGTVLLFSAEMTAQEVAKRELARMTGIPVQRQNRGDINAEEFERLALAQADIAKLPIVIDDGSGPAISRIRARSGRVDKRARRNGRPGVKLIVADYLGLFRDPVYAGDRVREIGSITRGLKNLAKDLGVPVVALSQLNRTLEQREDKRPILPDLRESGDIEQDADVVTFIYRPEYYLSKQEPAQRSNESADKFEERTDLWRQRMADSKDVAELIVAKQRDGPTGTVECFFSGPRLSFYDRKQPEE